MTFDAIRNAAGLSPKVLNRVIAELRSAKVLTGKKVGKYTEYEIEPELRKAYREHSDIIEAEKIEGAKENGNHYRCSDAALSPKQQEIMEWVSS